MAILSKRFALYFLALLAVVICLTTLLLLKTRYYANSRTPKQQAAAMPQTYIEDDHHGEAEPVEVIHRGGSHEPVEDVKEEEYSRAGMLKQEPAPIQREHVFVQNEQKIIPATSSSEQKQQIEGDQKNEQQAPVTPSESLAAPKNVEEESKVSSAKEEAATNIVPDSNAIPTAVPESKQSQRTTTPIIMCRNTVQGSTLITDSRGYTCSVELVDPVTKCCPLELPAWLKDHPLDWPTVLEQHSCQTCNAHHCCSVYEYCVSCCMNPQHRTMIQSIIQSKAQEGKANVYKGIQTVFQFCSTRCRTSSKSVVNENRYRTVYKHCYGAKDPSDMA